MPEKIPPHIAYLLRYLTEGPPTPARNISNSSVAQYVLASTGFMAQTQKKKSQARQSPSVLSRIIDAFSVPNYAIAEGFKRGVKEIKRSGSLDLGELAAFTSGLPTGAGSGARGAMGATNLRHKTTFSDVLGEAGVDNPVLKYGGGLALDIALDPTTYIGAGAIAKIAKIGKAPTAIIKLSPPKSMLAEEIGKIKTQRIPAGFTKPRPETKSIFPALSTISSMPRQDSVTRILPKPRQVAKAGSYEETVGRIVGQSVLQRSKTTRRAVRENIELGIPERIPTQINPAKQANVWNKLINEAAKYLMEVRKVKNPMAPRFNTARQTIALRMLTAAETAMEEGGRVLVGWDGLHVRLGDVLAELPERRASDVVGEFTKKPGSEIDPDVAQAVENARARSVMEEAPKIKEAISTSLREKTKLDMLPLSVEAKTKLNKEIVKAGENAARLAKVSPSSAVAVRNVVKDVLYGPVGSPFAVAERYKGIDSPEAKAALTRALEKTLDPHKTLKTEGVVDWVMARMATWWGQKDLRPLVLHSIGSALAAAERRWRSLNALAKKHSPVEISNAWQAAKGSAPTSTLALQVRQAVSDSVGILHRSAVSMDDINKHLLRVKAPFVFTDAKKVVDSAGREFNFSVKGEGWKESWKTWEIEEPMEMLHRLTLATENAAREKAVIDEIAERFGARVPTREFRTKVDHHYLQGYWFDAEIAPQIHRVLREMDNFYDPKGAFMQMADKAISAWKSGVTIYAPSHHIRNLIGDTFLSWIAGVNDPRVYALAGRVLRSKSSSYIDVAMEPTQMFKGVPAQQGIGVKTLFKNKSGVNFNVNQIYAAAFNRGLLLPAKQVEDIFGTGELIKKGSLWKGEGLQPFGGFFQRKARGLAETREHYVRMAHFVHEVQKSKSKNLAKIFDDSARKVRKWHPDGLDLTFEERRVLRRLAPFYSWTRKAIPLVIEGAAQKPAKAVLFAPRANYAIQGSLGIETEAPSEQFPVDQLFPLWLREKGIGPQGGTAGSYTIVNPGNPLIDLTAQFGNPLSGVGEMLNPIIRIPMEKAFGREIYSQTPIQDDTEYFTRQIPIASNVQRIANVGLSGMEPRQGEEQLDKEALINFLTAIGYRETGDYERQAHFEELERRRNERRASR